MSRVRFSEFANNELMDACNWYEQQQPGLGLRFRNDVREATRRIALSPLLFPVELDEVRRYVMNRFPYPNPPRIGMAVVLVFSKLQAHKVVL